MTAIIWLFFLIMIILALHWYVQNRDATGTFDSTIGYFAMKEEPERFNGKDKRNLWQASLPDDSGE